MKQRRKRVDPEKLNIMDRCYYECLKEALTRTGGKLQPAAKLLDISNLTARKHARQLGLWPWNPPSTNGKTKSVRGIPR